MDVSGGHESAAFSRAWPAQATYVFGGQLASLGLPLTAVLVLHANVGQMAVLTAIGALPFVTIGPLLGIWADRFPRRRMVLTALAVRVVILAFIPIAYVGHLLALTMVFGVAFAVGSLGLAFDVSFEAMLPEIVSKSELVGANSRLELSEAVSDTVGSGAAGGLVQIVSAPLSLAADMVGSALAALQFVRVRSTVEHHEATPPSQRLLSSLYRGLRVVRSEVHIFSTAMADATSMFFIGSIGALYVLFAVDVVGLSPLLLGLVFGIGSVGSILGGLFSHRLVLRLGLGQLLWISVSLDALGQLIIAFATRDQGWYTLILAESITAFGAVCFNVGAASIRQIFSPPELLGRVAATVRFLNWSLYFVGALFGGVVADLVGLRYGIAISAVGIALGAVWLLRTSTRNLVVPNLVRSS